MLDRSRAARRSTTRIVSPGTSSAVSARIRADGRVELKVHAEITTEDGKQISLNADGVGIPQEGSPVFLLRENATLTTNYPEYAWLNAL